MFFHCYTVKLPFGYFNRSVLFSTGAMDALAPEIL